MSLISHLVLVLVSHFLCLNQLFLRIFEIKGYFEVLRSNLSSMLLSSSGPSWLRHTLRIVVTRLWHSCRNRPRSKHLLKGIVSYQLILLILNRFPIALTHHLVVEIIIHRWGWSTASTSHCCLLRKICIGCLSFIPPVLFEESDDRVDVVFVEHGLEVHDSH